MSLARRICITGAPRAGKTTRANALLVDFGLVRHTDDVMRKPWSWSGASAEVAGWFDDPGPWVIEGVAVPRALRKWLAAHSEGKPCDVLLFLARPSVPLTAGQETMRKGIVTVLRQISGELVARGVEIVTKVH